LSRRFFDVPPQFAPSSIDGSADPPRSRFWARRGWLSENGRFSLSSRTWLVSDTSYQTRPYSTKLHTCMDARVVAAQSIIQTSIYYEALILPHRQKKGRGAGPKRMEVVRGVQQYLSLYHRRCPFAPGRKHLGTRAICLFSPISRPPGSRAGSRLGARAGSQRPAYDST
jgi:hypothetical protein